jgi:hypothetical protein
MAEKEHQRKQKREKEEEARTRESEPYSPSRATSPLTEDDMDVDLLDYEEEEEEQEEDILDDILDVHDDDWSRNLGGMRELLNPDDGIPKGAAIGGAAPASTTVGSLPTATSAGQPALEDRNVEASASNVVTVEARQQPNLGLPGGTATASARIAASEAELEAQTLAEKKREILAALGGESLAYNTIKKAGMQKTRAYSLLTGEQTTAVDLGSFVLSLNRRLRTAEVAVNLGQKRTWSYSFNSKTMECGCAQHKNMISFPRRGSGVKGGRQVIWLCDQSMPPILPATDESNCVKIIRLEYGLLGELAEGLITLLAGRQVAEWSS